MYCFEDLVNIIGELRSEHGCPWDKEQTHESMVACMREECEEAVAAIENRDMENLCEELGDVLFQVVFHSQMAKEAGEFTVEDVVDGICKKMVRRHPHVFGDAVVNSPGEGLALWEEIKRKEKEDKN